MEQTVRAENPPSSPGLLQTKLHPPAEQDQLVARDRLLDSLRPDPGLRLVVVAAPAGYGKTTLLDMWRRTEASRPAVAWLTVDERDNDAVVLWSHVLEALRRVCPGVGLSASPEIVGATGIVDVVLPQLVNDLSDQGEVALILDDFHKLSSGLPQTGSRGSSSTLRRPSRSCWAPAASRRSRWVRCGHTARCARCAPTSSGSPPTRRKHS